MATFKRAGENLVRHIGGTYYLRAKVGGKTIRESLETKDLRTAKLLRADKLRQVRQRAVAETGAVRKVGEALEQVRAERLEAPHIKESTRTHYKSSLDYLAGTLPLTAAGHTWSAAEARKWWAVTSKRFSPYRANAALAMARRVAAALIEAGLRSDDPTAKLKRMRVVETYRWIPSRDEMEKIIESVRSQKKRVSKHAASMVAFLAFSGMRVAEARGLLWEDIQEEWVVVTGGELGTKNRKVRRLPITEPLSKVIEAMRTEESSGKVFNLISPRFALTGACKRLGFDLIRVHDLRHFFCTWAISSGIDVPTVAGWVGHSDGGMLLLKTYGHLLDSHSLESAKKLK